jgi:hypothetical protein
MADPRTASALLGADVGPFAERGIEGAALRSNTPATRTSTTVRDPSESSAESTG